MGTSISFHLTELRGMARHVERFSPLGLRVETVGASLSAAGAFLVKATEVQQVIDNSMKKYKAFFRWLFLVGYLIPLTMNFFLYIEILQNLLLCAGHASPDR